MVNKTVENLKILLPETNEKLLRLLVEKSKKTLRVQFNIKNITDDMYDIVEDIAMYKFNTLEYQGIDGESMGSNSINFNEKLPQNIIDRVAMLVPNVRFY